MPAMFSAGGFRAVDIQRVMGDLQKANVPAGTLNDLQTHITQQDTQINQLTQQTNDLKTQAANLTTANTGLTQQVATQDAQITQLKSQLAAATAAQPQQVAPLDLAMSLKSVVDKVQAAARQGTGVQATLSKMDIEVKTLINVTPSNEAVLVIPDPKALPDPAHLSTMTLSFGAIPKLTSPPPPPAVQPAGGGTPPAGRGGPQPAGPTGPAQPSAGPGGRGPARPEPKRPASGLQRFLNALEALGERRRGSAS
ncbi:MAG TPA: hypothetical protein VFL28_11360 [bacterium]|nr:hypothetical protein [bacterium]